MLCAHHRADIGHLQQLLLRGLHQAIDRAEVPRQVTRRARPHGGCPANRKRCSVVDLLRSSPSIRFCALLAPMRSGAVSLAGPSV